MTFLVNERQFSEELVKPMHKLSWSFLTLVLAVCLVSACTRGENPPPVTGQVMSLPTSQPTTIPTEAIPTDSFEPITTPAELCPTEIAQPTSALPDVVHLGVAWAGFSLRFDPLQWEIGTYDEDQPDQQALNHRTLSGCRITPNRPVGLGEGWRTEKEGKSLGQLNLESRSFYQDGELKFVGYYNFINPYGDGAVEVHFEDNPEACIQAAEALFATTEVILP